MKVTVLGLGCVPVSWRRYPIDVVALVGVEELP